MELLYNGFPDSVLKTRGFELLKKAVRWLAWKPQVPVQNAYEGFGIAAQLNGNCVRVSVCVVLCECCVLV
jgi:hypothetical protein